MDLDLADNFRFDNIKTLVDFMKDNEIISIKTDEISLEITKESIVRRFMEKNKSNVPSKPKETLKKSKDQDGELKKFIYGSDNINRKEIGELYGV